MIPSRKTAQPRIVQPGSGRLGWYLVLILLPVCVLVSSWYAYEYGRTGILFNSMEATSTVTLAQQQVTALQQQVKELEAERTKLREEVAVLGRTSQIDREAVRVVGEDMKQAQDERLKMEEELVFLRGIISNKVDKKALRIQDFRLQSSKSPLVFTYGFTVSQVLDDKNRVKGDLFITLNGKQKNKKKSLTLAKLTEEKSKSLEIDFKHFQKFEGMLQLPKGFKVNNMVIEIKPSKKKMPRLSETFKWFVEE